MKPLRTLDDLIKHGLINAADAPSLAEVVDKFSLTISQQMHDLIDKTNPHDPIAKQFVPSVQELITSPLEQTDPIGDEIHASVKGIVHRYPDRCLFTPVHICPIYCRFCFRREKIGNSELTLTPAEMEAAYDYIDQHKEIWEVILTGGDPFILKPNSIKTMLDRLSKMDHIEVIRIHTRVPIVDSHRINQEMIDALRCDKTIYVLLHANHSKELTPEAIRACSAIIDAGIPMLSQTTLLKDINDNIETLSKLMRCLVKNRIKPYYLHQTDLAKGTQHFRTSIEHGQQLIKQLRGRFSGLCQPTYVLDIPGGHGKVPIGPNYMTCEAHAKDNYQIEDYQGNLHDYAVI